MNIDELGLDMEANTANISIEGPQIVNESYRLATGGSNNPA